MKAFKIIVLATLSIFFAMYLAFLFVLPNAIDLNKYSHQISKIIQDNTSIQVEFKNIKIKTAWDLSLVALSEKVDLKYQNGEKFAQINGLKVRLSLLPLIFKQIKINKIEAEKFFVNIKKAKSKKQKVKSDGNTFCLLPFAFYSNSHTSIPLYFRSSKMPDIMAKKYRISFIDGKNNYSLKGSDLKISDFVLNKKIKVKTIGKVVLNDRVQINYDIAIFSKVFLEKSAKKIDLLKIFEDLYKYNVHANIDANLNIKKEDIDGKIGIDKILFSVGNNIYPPSTLKLIFKGDKAKINASLHVNKDSKAVITGILKTGKKKLINLHVISDEIQIEDIFSIVQTVSKSLGIKNLSDINAKGLLKADFNIKSNFKKIESNGYLKIKDANIVHKNYKVDLDSINTDIDFSQDTVRIKNASAKLNSQPIIISGTVDKNAIADISILAKNLPLKSVLLTLGQTKTLKENDILDGYVNINLSLNGRLDKAFPKANIIVSNLNLKNKQSKTQIKIAKTIINSDFDKKDINIEKTYVYINNIKADLSGKISNITTNPVLNPLTVSIPNQIPVPIKGYARSKVLIKGNINLIGDLSNPQLQGLLNIPLISIPSQSTTIKNATLKADKEIILNCPYIQASNSLMKLNAEISNNLQKGLVLKNVDFSSDNIDLNTLSPILRVIFSNSNSNVAQNLTILNGKNTIKNFKVSSITSTNVASDISLKDNILYFNNIFCDAYFGKIAGNINYNLKNRKTNLNLQGRDLIANLAMTGLSGKNNDINGKLDFDSNISFIAYSRDELLNSLKGNVNFIILNGGMGMLGKLEHLIYAQNILSNNIFKASLNIAARSLTVKNTGVYKYMKGKINLSNGWANIEWIKTSGPSMSLYITGRYYLPDNVANLIMLGRISNDVVNVLGPIGEFSVKKAFSSIPKIGEATTSTLNQYTTNPSYENVAQIPYLTPKTEFPTKEFKVVIDGETQKQNSVKSFKWLSKPIIVQPPPVAIEQKTIQPLPDFVKNLPDLKN